VPNAIDAGLSDPEFLTRIEHLQLLSRRLFRGRQRAERRSRKTGASLEFADYRDFVAGDDLRSVDWSLYGRSDRLFLKLYEEEEDLHVHVLVDCSASMSMPSTDSGKDFSKFTHARRLAAALAYISLCGLDRVDIYGFSGTLEKNAGMRRGRQQFHVLIKFLRQLGIGTAKTSFSETARQFVSRVKRRGLVIVISDFLDPAGCEDGLNIIRYARFEVQVVQVFSREEIDPPFGGDLQLVDTETGERISVNASRSLLKDYRAAMLTRIRAFESFCAKRGIGCARTITDESFEDSVLLLLRQARLVG
jgi:uncharacterized protein (DUF58 family)